jgi:hypothetical protein
VSPAAPPPAIVSPASPLSRILAGESATAALADWCAVHGLPTVEAHLAPGAAKAAGREVRTLLGQHEPLRFRHVALVCGVQTVSTADNWYAPGQLTAEMNRRLETTDAPFGLVVKPLGFTRRTLATRQLGGGRVEVRAVLVSPAGTAFSYVVERYAATVR